jgi:hypothetical protein
MVSTAEHAVKSDLRKTLTERQVPVLHITQCSALANSSCACTWQQFRNHLTVQERPLLLLLPNQHALPLQLRLLLLLNNYDCYGNDALPLGSFIMLASHPGISSPSLQSVLCLLCCCCPLLQLLQHSVHITEADITCQSSTHTQHSCSLV